MKEKRAALLREADRYAAQALDAGEVPDAEAVREVWTDAAILGEWIKAHEPRAERLIHQEAEAARWAAERQRREVQEKADVQKAERLAACLGWLEKRLSGTLGPVLHDELKAEAEKAGYGDVLWDAGRELGVVKVQRWASGGRRITVPPTYWQLPGFVRGEYGAVGKL